MQHTVADRNFPRRYVNSSLLGRALAISNAPGFCGVYLSFEIPYNGSRKRGQVGVLLHGDFAIVDADQAPKW